VTLTDNELYELELNLAMAQKLIDGEIEVECGSNPVDKEHAISVYIREALRVLKKE